MKKLVTLLLASALVAAPSFARTAPAQCGGKGSSKPKVSRVHHAKHRTGKQHKKVAPKVANPDPSNA